jgi:hypothetical protein
MAVLPHPWNNYARLQTELRRNNRIDRAWGAEAALTFICSIGSPASDDADRAARSEARRERHRAVLRRWYLSEDNLRIDPRCGADLALIKAWVTPADWDLLSAIGEGCSYQEVAAKTGQTPGALRVRVTRLRKRLFRAAND